VRAFADTNILVYAYSTDARAERARELLPKSTVSAQCLNEFVNVARNKLRMSWPELKEALYTIEALCDLREFNDLAVHRLGIGIAERYRLATFDSMLVAAALLAGCNILWSEDMQDGLVVDGTLTVRNPFVQLG